MEQRIFKKTDAATILGYQLPNGLHPNTVDKYARVGSGVVIKGRSDISKGMVVDIDALAAVLAENNPDMFGGLVGQVDSGIAAFQAERAASQREVAHVTQVTPVRPLEPSDVTQVTPDELPAERSLLVPEQAVMASLVKSQRDDLRARDKQIEQVKKSVWTVTGILVATLIGVATLGWLLTATVGRLRTARAVTGEKIVQIAGLNDRVGGLTGHIGRLTGHIGELTGQLDQAAKREGRKLAEIVELKKMVTDSASVKDDLAERLAELQVERLAAEQVAGGLRAEIEKLRNTGRREESCELSVVSGEWNSGVKDD